MHTKEELQSIYDKCGTIKESANILGYSPEWVRKLFITHDVNYSKKKRFVYDPYCFSDDSEASFYWAGFISADGNVSRKGDLHFGLKRSDESHVILLKRYIESDCTLERCRDGEFSQIRLRCPEIVTNLSRFGVVPKKSLIYTIPDEILSNNLFKHFIRGYSDGDGWFSVIKGKSRWGIAGTKSVCEAIRSHLIDTLSLDSKGILCSRGNFYVLTFSRQMDVYKIYKYLYSNSSISLPRKMKKAQRSEETLKNTNIFHYSKQELELLYKKFNSYSVIANYLGCSKSVVAKYIKKYNIKVNNGKRN